MCDTNTSARAVPSRRVHFPPLQFVSEGVETTTKHYNIRSHVPKHKKSSHTADQSNTNCREFNYDDKVAGSAVCFEHVAQEVVAETSEDLQLTVRHRITNMLAVGCVDFRTTTEEMNVSNDKLMTAVHSELPCCEIDDDSVCREQLVVGRILDVNHKELTTAENFRSPVLSQNKQSPGHAQNCSAEYFDIDTPTRDVDPSDCREWPQKVVNEIECETAIHPNMSVSADSHFVEPVHVLSFSHLDKSLDETDSLVERVICAAELNKDMSELVDRDEDKSVNARVDCNQPFCRDRTELLSTLNALTPLENLSKNTVLVSDTPLCDYGLSYRQRVLKAASIRLRHRTHKS